LVNEESEISARIVKGRIEKTLLGDIADYIKEVYGPKGCYLSVKLDAKTIQKLMLEVNIHAVKAAILKAVPKKKLAKQNVSVTNDFKLHVTPSGEGKGGIYYEMQKLKLALPKVMVKGIPNVMRAVISRKEQDESKLALLVEGKGLQRVMVTPGIDFTRTKSNHVIEVEEVLGIEAARRTIIHEIRYTMQQHGMKIDDRHMMLLADIMTFQGQVYGITRFGVSKMKTSTLMLASFEMTTNHLLDAAVQCRRDEITGVSESIIVGNMVPLGTGNFKLVHDEGAEEIDSLMKE